MSSLNWSDLQRSAAEAGFTTVPADEYDAYVESATAAKTANGKDMIRTRFRIETGPHAGKPVFNQFVISPDNANALAFFFRHMRVLGLDDAFFAGNPSTEQVASALINKRSRIRVSIRQWQDQDRNQVDAVLPPANGQPAAEPRPSTPTPGPNLPGGMAHFASSPPGPPLRTVPTPPAPDKPKLEPPDLPF